MDPKAIADSLAPTLRQGSAAPAPTAVPEKTLSESMKVLSKQMLDPPRLKEFVGGAIQDTFRGLQALGNTLLGRSHTTLPENAPPIEKQVYQTVFGHQDNPTLKTYGSEFLRNFGVDTSTADKYGTAVGLPLSVLSVIPGGGKASRALTEKLFADVAKESDPLAIARTLDAATQRIAPEAIRGAAADLAKISKPAEVQSYIREFLQKNGGTMNAHAPKAIANGMKIIDETAAGIAHTATDPELGTTLRTQIGEMRAYVEANPDLPAASLNKILADAEDTLGRLKSITTEVKDTVAHAALVADHAAQSGLVAEKSRFTSADDLIREMGTPKNGQQGLYLNRTEIKQLVDHLASLSADTKGERGVIYKPYGYKSNGVADIILGETGLEHSRIGGGKIVAEITPEGKLNGHFRVHATPLREADVLARLNQEQFLALGEGVPKAPTRALGESMGFHPDTVAGRSAFDPTAAKVALARGGAASMTEIQSLEKMAAEASSHEQGLTPEAIAAFGGDPNLVALADKTEMARQYRSMMEDAVANHPAAPLLRYTTNDAKLGDNIPQLADMKRAPGVNAKGQPLKDNRSLFSRSGDTMIEELSGGAYKTLDEANAGLADLYHLKQEAAGAKGGHIDLTKQLATESRITKSVSGLPPQEGGLATETPLGGQTERGFSETVRTSPGTAPEVAAKVASFYDPISNKDTLEQATAVVAKGEDAALSFVHDMREPTALSNAVAQLLVEKYQSSGRIDAAVSLVRHVAEKATTQGQATQVLSLWNRLTPGGILRAADKELAGVGKKLDPKLAKKLVDASNKARDMAPGWEKSFETAKMLKLISDELPTTLLKKVSLTQTMLLLLNPKTWIRNLVGNTGFVALENVADLPAAMLDSAMSLFNGVRTKVPPSILAQSRGALRGTKEAWHEALAGVNTTGVKSQFEIPSAPIFRGRVGKAAETLLNVELRVPDRAFYQAAYDGSIYQQMRAANLSARRAGGAPVLTPTQAMMEVAHHDGLYRTFQDDSAISKAFVGIKKVLNGGKDFGLGDILMKFPKTPGNLLARGIDYSPAGFVKMVYEASRPLVGKRFNQKAFVESFGRATVGTTGLVGTGVLLNRLGILTGKAGDNTDVREAKRAVGLGDYQINTSALKRFVLSGMDAASAKPQKGDVMMTYDFFQPAAMPIAIGANISVNHGVSDGSFLGEIFNAVLQGADTVTAQPALQNLQKLFNDAGYYGIVGALGKQVQTLPASFVPTLLNQVRALLDSNQRNTYSNDAVKYAFNLVKNKLPIASETLKPAVSPYGDLKQTYQDGSNNPFNVLFNPLFVTKYKDDPAVNMVLDMFKQTGDSSAVPDLKAQKQKINGKDTQLGPNQYYALQKFVGEKTRFYLESFAADPAFQALDDTEKANYVANVLKDIGVYGKIIILGDRPKTLSGRVRQMMAQDYGG